MSRKNVSRFIKAVLFCMFIGVLLTPRNGYAGTDNGIGNGGQNNGHGNGGNNGHHGDNGDNGGGEDDGGDSGSVPVNGGIIFLAIGGVAYTAWKFYDLKKQRILVA